MALFDTTWYANWGDGSTTGYWVVTTRPQNTAVAAGVVRRQFTAPAAGSERCFVCIVAGTTANTTDATWVLTRGAKTTDGTATWQECTGQAAVNGDATNTVNWTTVKNQSVTLGQIIKRNNGASYQICSTAGTTGNGSEPSFSDTAGTTTADNTVTWTSLGVVGNFTAFGAPHARLAAAFTATWGDVGDKFFIGDNCAETSAGNTSLTSPGTVASPCQIYCVDRTVVPPTASSLRTTASFSTTGATFLSIGGFHYWYGCIFSGASTTTSGNQCMIIGSGAASVQQYEKCSFRSGAASAGGDTIIFGPSSGGGSVYLVFTDCTMKFAKSASVGVALNNACRVVWKGSNNGSILASGSSVPTNLFITQATMSLQYATIVFEGCDFTDFGTNQIVASAGSTPRVQYTFKDCKANSAAVWGGSVASPIGPTVDYIRCGVNNYTSGRFWYQGTQSTETTIILTGGASDGTTPISWKVATTSVNSWFSPFEFIPISIWNDTTGSPKTVTINAVRSTSGLPNTDDIWIVAEYMGTSGNPNGSFATNTKASGLDAGVAYSASGASWAGSPSGTPFAMSVTITPQNKGPITVYVKAGAASSTFYVDPKIIVT